MITYLNDSLLSSSTRYPESRHGSPLSLNLFFKYRILLYISPWAYTSVVVFCGLIDGDGPIHGGLYTGVSEALELWLICSSFSQIIMYFNDFWVTWAYTRGAYIRVLKLRSDSGRFYAHGLIHQGAYFWISTVYSWASVRFSTGRGAIFSWGLTLGIE